MSKKNSKLVSFIIVFFLIISPIFTRSVSYGAVLKDIPFIVLSNYKKTMEIGEEFWLTAVTSTGKLPTFKSSDSKVASVNTYGRITAKKAGAAKITAIIKKAEASCQVTVKQTSIKLNKKTLSLEHGETFQLVAAVSTNAPVSWKSSKKSVISITEDGLITALKPGESIISASADFTKATCKVTVKKPTIRLSKSSLSMKPGECFQLTAQVSSHLPVDWKSSKRSVALVDEDGNITALKEGFTVITAKLDGVSKTCQVTVKASSP